eukprot:m.123987 g.123987  ORF g.123987 m.123987 type:complete len:441 (+) comp16275_c0_seq1:361-1683(+)
MSDFQPSQKRALLQQFAQWTDDDQVDFATGILQTMRPNLLGQVYRVITNTLQKDFLTELPYELVDCVLTFLKARELLTCALVCRAWHSMVTRTGVWRILFNDEVRASRAWRDFSSLESTKRWMHMYKPTWNIVYKTFYVGMKQLQQNWEHGVPTRMRFLCNGDGVYCLQYDEHKIVIGNRDNNIKVYDMAGVKQYELAGHTGSVLCLQYDNEKIISGSSDSKIRVWSLATRSCVAILDRHEQSVLHLRFDKQFLVTCSKDHFICIWKIDSMNQYTFLRRLEGHRAAVNVVDFDGRLIVSGSGDRTIKVWTTDGALVRVLVGHSRGIACLQFRGDYIVSGSSDESIRVWNVETGECLRTLVGHRGLIRCLRFDESYIITGSYDQKIMVWDFKTGRVLQTLMGHENRVFRVQFDSFKIISSSQDDSVCIWNFMPQNILPISN